MKISELSRQLDELKEKHGDIDALITTSYSHHEIKWIDYYEARLDCIEHICIRVKDTQREPGRA